MTAAGQAAIAVRAADDEFARGVDVELALLGHPAAWQGGFHQRPEHALDVGLIQMLFMLGGDDDAGCLDWLSIDVAQRDLALGVGQQSRDGLVLDATEFRDPAQDQMGVEKRRRHKALGLPARIPEHDALVAGTFILVAGGIHALSDVGGLGVQVALDFGALPTEAGLIVADIVDRHAAEMLE